MPNLEALLKACRQQSLAMGIISNAQFFTPLLFEWFLNARMEQLGFDSELIFLSYQLGYAKPSRALFKMAASAINAKEGTRSSYISLVRSERAKHRLLPQVPKFDMRRSTAHRLPFPPAGNQDSRSIRAQQHQRCVVKKRYVAKISPTGRQR